MNNKLTHVKWAGPNTPMIRLDKNDSRLYMSKKELLDLYQELSEFIEYYKKDFTEPNLDWVDDFDIEIKDFK